MEKPVGGLPWTKHKKKPQLLLAKGGQDNSNQLNYHLDQVVTSLGQKLVSNGLYSRVATLNILKYFLTIIIINIININKPPHLLNVHHGL